MKWMSSSHKNKSEANKAQAAAGETGFWKVLEGLEGRLTPALPTCPDWRSRSKLATGHRAAAPSWWDPHRPLRLLPLNNRDKTTTGRVAVDIK